MPKITATPERIQKVVRRQRAATVPPKLLVNELEWEFYTTEDALKLIYNRFYGSSLGNDSVHKFFVDLRATPGGALLKIPGKWPEPTEGDQPIFAWAQLGRSSYEGADDYENDPYQLMDSDKAQTLFERAVSNFIQHLSDIGVVGWWYDPNNERELQAICSRG